ncbi:MAG TPA: RNA polymerase subunit sigma-70 [Candidatus Limnocylindrales bacterium]|jgi:RNA polymerase sigma-70 factor (ECF subfamily)
MVAVPSPAGLSDSFDELAAAHRRALLAHSYRMLGSIDDAEDAVQEAFARAWRGRETYRQDVSARAWLYRIATNVCLDALERRKHATGSASLAAIEPIPEALLADVSTEPHARYDAHESITLAFLEALQRLTPTQRAALILRDVLGWRAAEVAGLLEVSPRAAESSLRRARVAMAGAGAAAGATPAPTRPSAVRSLLDRYVRAWEAADIAGLVALLREDAIVTMPPGVMVTGTEAIARFLAEVVFDDERRIRMAPVRANGGIAYLVRSASRSHPELGPYAVIVVALDDMPAITSMTVFAEPRVAARFAEAELGA